MRVAVYALGHLLEDEDEDERETYDLRVSIVTDS